MNVILKSARIIDLNSKHHNKVKDILIEDGIIKKIDKKILRMEFLSIQIKIYIFLQDGWIYIVIFVNLDTNIKMI